MVERKHNQSRHLCGWLAFSLCAPCLAFSILMSVLLLSVIFVVLEIPLGVPPLTVGQVAATAYREVLVPITSLLGEMLKSLSPWGLIAFCFVAVVFWGPSWIRDSLSSSKWELPGGIKFDGTGALQLRKEIGEAAKGVEKANKEIEDAYLAAQSFAANVRDRYDISTAVSEVTQELVKELKEGAPPDFRLTLYVPDFVFADRLYQLTDYYNRDGKKGVAGKAGRTFSIRYGVIGRVWRSGVSEIEGDLISAEDRKILEKSGTSESVNRFIARRWGLTLKEAEKVKDYSSYAALILKREEKSYGVLYFDSKRKDAFCTEGDQKNLEMRILNVLEKASIVSKLQEISDEVASWSGRIQIFQNS